MRAFGLRDESVLAKASSRPLQTYRPRTSLLNGVYCAVAGVGITIYSLRRSWGTILDSGLTASRAYRAMWSATNAPAGERLVFHRVSGTRTGYAPDPRRLAEKSGNVRTIVHAPQHQKRSSYCSTSRIL